MPYREGQYPNLKSVEIGFSMEISVKNQGKTTQKFGGHYVYKFRNKY